jgi:hypothetical protein
MVEMDAKVKLVKDGMLPFWWNFTLQELNYAVATTGVLTTYTALSVF